METKREVWVGGGIDECVHFSFDIHEDITWIPAPMHGPCIANIQRAFIWKCTRVEVIEAAVHA